MTSEGWLTRKNGRAGKGNRDPRDSFENWLTYLLDDSIGKQALSNVSFESVVGHDVCRVEAKPSGQPIYARGEQSMDYYGWLTNGTGSLNIEEAVNYPAAHEWSRL